MSIGLKPANIEFLKVLERNNNRDWFNDHKGEYKHNEKFVKNVFEEIFKGLKKEDHLDSYKIFRIYRDIRFSKNKLPYKTHYAASFHRIKPKYRGGYYVHLAANNKSFIATGFWDPDKTDLFRIRKEVEMDARELKEIIEVKEFMNIWGNLEGDELKSAPRDFDKNHPNIDLIKKKQFIFKKTFTDSEILSSYFSDNVIQAFIAIRPFFNYMSDVLTTDLNGESLI